MSESSIAASSGASTAARLETREPLISKKTKEHLKTAGLLILGLIGAVGLTIACLPADSSGVLEGYNNYFVLAAIPILSILIYKGMKKYGLDQQKWVAGLVIGLAIGVFAYSVFSIMELGAYKNGIYANYLPYAFLFLAPVFSLLAFDIKESQANERVKNVISVYDSNYQSQKEEDKIDVLMRSYRVPEDARIEHAKTTSAASTATTRMQQESYSNSALQTVNPLVSTYFNFEKMEENIFGGVQENYTPPMTSDEALGYAGTSNQLKNGAESMTLAWIRQRNTESTAVPVNFGTLSNLPPATSSLSGVARSAPSLMNAPAPTGAPIRFGALPSSSLPASSSVSDVTRSAQSLLSAPAPKPSVPSILLPRVPPSLMSAATPQDMGRLPPVTRLSLPSTRTDR